MRTMLGLIKSVWRLTTVQQRTVHLVALDDPLDDAMIEKGDEHTIQITGAPQASMMSLENPEALDQIASVAPAEGQRPLASMTDKEFEAMFNPDK